MSEGKFTPGPWLYEKSVDDSHRIYGGVFPGAKRAVYDIADLWLPDVEGDAESVRVANARLIAAAPELYEALDSVSISGPDADGIIWLHVKSNGLQGMFNLGSDPTTLAMRALIGAFELRRNALLKATEEKDR